MTLSVFLHMTRVVLVFYPQPNCPFPTRLAAGAVEQLATAFELIPLLIAAVPAVYSQICYLLVSQAAVSQFADVAFELIAAVLVLALDLSVWLCILPTLAIRCHMHIRVERFCCR